MANKTAYIAGGCFWGLEELFRTQPGVLDTEVGYAGGENDAPTYEYHPSHAETVKLTYDDSVTSFRELLDFFFRVHDPTTKNRQGNDVGSSYRSTIFYEDEVQFAEARAMIALTDTSGIYDAPVVTSLEPLTRYTPAEAYHQDYLQKNPGGYTCHFVRSEASLMAP